MFVREKFIGKIKMIMEIGIERKVLRSEIGIE